MAIISEITAASIPQVDSRKFVFLSVLLLLTVGTTALYPLFSSYVSDTENEGIFIFLALGWLSTAHVATTAFFYADRDFLPHAMALIVVGLGLHQMVLWPPRHEVQKIGQAIAEALGDANVADHNGYRFAAPFSAARFRFVHENDPGFPAAIIEEAHKLRPRFVLVTNTYKPLEQQVDTELPGYRKTLSWTYVHPLASFNERSAKNVIVLYERAGELNSLPNQHGSGAGKQ